MPKKPTYIQLPIYSICAHKAYIYFSGGGGGKTGIPNEIVKIDIIFAQFIFHGRVTPQPVNKINTGRNIIENMIDSDKEQLLICSANNNIIIFKIEQKGKSLTQIHQFQADFSFKNPTINSIYIHPFHKIFATGGDDKVVRFYSFSQPHQNIEIKGIWEHQEHQNAIRNIDGTGSQFYLSTDSQKITVVNLQEKQIIRKLYSDNLNPLGSSFQSAYFNSIMKNNQQEANYPKILFCHYLPRSSAFLTRQLPNGMYETMKISTDQSCLTAKNRNYIGMASGNGTTYIIDIEKFKCVGEQKRHEFVVTAATMTRGMRFITGTPQCSYFVQEAQDFNYNVIIAVFLTIFVVFLIHTLGAIHGISTGEL